MKLALKRGVSLRWLLKTTDSHELSEYEALCLFDPIEDLMPPKISRKRLRRMSGEQVMTYLKGLCRRGYNK